MRILDERREALVERERELLERLVAFLKNFGAPPEDVDLVALDEALTTLSLIDP